MEQALSAYSDEHILEYFNDVKTNGMTDQAFPRLTSNIGIIIAHGMRQDLLPIFLEMMEFCCKTIPVVKAANDFSVREIVSCLIETEKSGVISKADSERWRGYLASIKPTECYSKFATTTKDQVRNWALFTAVSEFFRQNAGLCDSSEFIELQLKQQLQWFDEKGMYRDSLYDEERYQPIMYDLVPRGLFALLLASGYRGESYSAIDEMLKRSGLLTLDMQSPNGEMAFGGRSNQFLHNEAWMIAVLEYEASRYAREGNATLAARFKAASARALAVTEEWLKRKPIRHVKNRFPTETEYGCEYYAYFDKYMITVASNLWAAYQICDETIPYEPCADHEPCVAETSHYFHKLFAKAGGYGLEFDLDADPLYDASGLGRIHREGAPSGICLSSPCPLTPKYKIDIEERYALSACSATKRNGVWELGAEPDCVYKVCGRGTTESEASAELCCRFKNGSETRESYIVNADGVSVRVCGDGEIGFALPALCFDGERHTDISVSEHSLSIAYDGWICRYSTDGEITDLGRIAANRNGHYKAFLAVGKQEIHVSVEIVKQ